MWDRILSLIILLLILILAIIAMSGCAQTGYIVTDEGRVGIWISATDAWPRGEHRQDHPALPSDLIATY